MMKIWKIIFGDVNDKRFCWEGFKSIEVYRIPQAVKLLKIDSKDSFTIAAFLFKDKKGRKKHVPVDVGRQ